MPIRPLAGACAALLLAACATAPLAPAPTAPAPAAAAEAPAAPRDIVVPEAWESAMTPAEELDSLATWTTPDGGTWLIASAKSMHRLVIYDGETGEQLRTVGGKGDAAGQFKRPNGVAVFGDRLFVVERDNHRVQVLSLPSFRPIGSFG
ncbi:MAG TPA: phytase, partial [Luteimonas sp.]|nr:phytase [Luteimonas sp.]